MIQWIPVPPLPEGAPPQAVVVLGGGAPNGAMMAGALAAIYDGGKTFTTIYSSGAGALIGMLYLAPRMPAAGMPGPLQAGLDPTIWALRQTLKFGIADEIYRWFPVGYKTFYKSGPVTRSWISATRALKIFEKSPDDAFNRHRRLYNDLIDLWASATCPTDVTPFSQGLCGDFPFASDIIDFDVLNNTPTLKFYMNAHHIETTSMQEFGPGEITPAHFDAALSYPFIYPPAAIEDQKTGEVQHYFEGGCVDPLNLEALADDIEAIPPRIVTRTVVIVDVLSTIESSLVRVPKGLWDAYGISIMLPVVSLARMSQKIFAMRMQKWNETHALAEQIETITLQFDVPPSVNPQVTDWSASNMQTCWNIGYASGRDLVRDPAVASRLPSRQEGNPFPILTEIVTASLAGSKAAKRGPETMASPGAKSAGSGKKRSRASRTPR